MNRTAAGSPAAERQRTPGVVLTPRDLALAADVWAFGLLTRDQIHELHFGGNAGIGRDSNPGVGMVAGTALRRVNRRLLRLAQAGLLTGAPLPLGQHPLSTLLPATGSGAAAGGGPQRAYRLGPRGAEPVARWLAQRGWDSDATSVRRRTATAEAPGFAAHALAVADARIALERASRRRAAEGTWRLRAFYGEALLAHAFEVQDTHQGTRPNAPWQRYVFKPDGLAVVEFGDGNGTGNGGGNGGTPPFYLFLEVDLSSVAAAEIAHKLHIHARYRASLFSRRYGDAPPGTFLTVVLTTGARRAENLAQVAAREGAAAFTRVATLAALADAACDPLLSPIWMLPGRPGTHPLFRVSHEAHHPPYGGTAS